MLSEESKAQYMKRYKQAKQKGIKFWPDIIYKDLIVSFALFLILVGLATFIGVASEARADPSDSSYIPRPEWYFLFLFKFLAIYGQVPVLGKIEWIATALIPGIAVGALFLLPFIDRNPFRHFSKRRFGIAIMSLIVVWMILLTFMATLPLPPNDAELAFSNMLQAIAGLWIPFATILLLFFLAFISNTNDKNAASQKKLMLGVSGAAMIAMVAVFAVAAARASSYPPVEEEESVANTISEKIVAGQDLYSVQCVECHGPDGEGGEIHGVEGLDGVYVKPINSQDEMWTRTDETLANIIDFGQQDLGMPPYGVAYGGPLKKSEIDYIVTFMRYTWDSRAEVPADAASAGAIPALAEGEIPSWEVHIQPLTKRYCLSCHREGKENNNYLMSTYQEMITTGDNAGKNLIPGDPDNSYVGLTINGHPILDDAGNEIITQMPPTKLIKEDYIDMLERWIAAGMPETAEEAAALQGDGAGSAESP